MKTELYLGDCLEIMKQIPDASIDLILTDLPYGTTACKWDTIIPFDLMWTELKRIRKDKGAIVLFGSEPFSSHLRLSNIKEFKYDWIWQKTRPSNFINCKKRPLLYTENISVFGGKTYIPQMCEGKKNHSNKGIKTNAIINNTFAVEIGNTSNIKYPRNIIDVPSLGTINRLHPTQKPVKLLEYLIKTYTLEGEIVLDFTMGSGSTGVACKNLNRNFIGIEKDETYFNIAKQRIEGAT